MASKQLVVFTLDGEEFGIDITKVNIIEKPLEIFKIPNAPDFVEGIINLRGKVHTLMNLRKKFSMPNKDFDDSTRFIIVNTNSSIIGLIVDEVREIVTVDEENMEATPQTLSGLQKECVPRVAKIESRVILLLDLEALIST